MDGKIDGEALTVVMANGEYEVIGTKLEGEYGRCRRLRDYNQAVR